MDGLNLLRTWNTAMTEQVPSTFKIITASLLVAGTCIGGGMLALPVTAAPGGLLPTICSMLVIWLMMTTTACVLIELGFWMKKPNAHIITMASTILGKWGAALTWILFLFISYASLIAYTAGCGHFFSSALTYFHIAISPNTGCWLFILTFGLFLFGSKYVLGKTNDLLFLLMITAYILLIWHGLDDVTPVLFLRRNWHKAHLAIPLLVTAFSFQTMVPSLHPFLNHHRRSLRKAVLLGTIFALSIYMLWMFVILGTIPLEGKWGLEEALHRGEPATHALIQITKSPIIAHTAAFFALFALITSFFGMGMGLFDFLSDGLKIAKKGKGNILLGILVLLPSLLFAVSYERVFITALDLSGGFGDTILNGALPIIMFWVGSRRFLHTSKRNKHLLRIGATILLCLYLLIFAFEAKLRLFSTKEEASIEHFEFSIP